MFNPPVALWFSVEEEVEIALNEGNDSGATRSKQAIGLPASARPRYEPARPSLVTLDARAEEVASVHSCKGPAAGLT
jgi:hypothetical protein